MGHSYGGNLLFDALPMLPRLRGLLAVGAPPISTGADAGQAFRFDETGGLFYAPALTADQALDLARYVLQPIPDPADVTRLLADLTRADGRFRAATAAAIAAGALADERGHVQVTPVPLAFAAGEFDPLLNPGYFDTLPAPTLWGQHLHRVPAASHLPMLENPAAFNALLLAFADGE